MSKIQNLPHSSGSPKRSDSIFRIYIYIYIHIYIYIYIHIYI